MGVVGEVILEHATRVGLVHDEHGRLVVDDAQRAVLDSLHVTDPPVRSLTAQTRSVMRSHWEVPHETQRSPAQRSAQRHPHPRPRGATGPLPRATAGAGLSDRMARESSSSLLQIEPPNSAQSRAVLTGRKRWRGCGIVTPLHPSMFTGVTRPSRRVGAASTARSAACCRPRIGACAGAVRRI